MIQPELHEGVLADARHELLSMYERFQADWAVVDRREDYAHLVVPSGNADEALHRWFHVKEAYSCNLLPRILKDSDWSGDRELRILDPFSGSGTTAVSAASCAADVGQSLYVRAVEANPVLAIVSDAKIAGMTLGASIASKVERLGEDLLAEYKRISSGSYFLSTPSATLNNSQFFDPNSRNALLLLGYLAKRVVEKEIRVILQTAVASAVECSGRIRRDGRALRYCPTKRPIDPAVAFQASLRRMVADLKGTPNRASSVDAALTVGDARRASSYFSGETFDLIVFSPPYPNNIDYTEVYKTEAWALDLFEDEAHMRAQRLSTLRSHSSIYFPNESEPEAILRPIVSTLARVVPYDRYEKGRRQLITGYLHDMYKVLKSAREVISQSGKLVLVVGNSIHGSGEDRLLIASDVILGRLGELASWEVEEVRIARGLHRRGHAHELLRESVVVLRPA